MNEKKLPYLILILPVLSLLLSMFLFIIIYVNQQKKIANRNIEYIEKLYVKHAINIEKNKIKTAFDIVLSDYEHIDEVLKPKLRERVDIAYRIIMNLYKDNRGLNKEKITKIIKEAICPIRFDNNEGYFFIYNMEGVNILSPFNKNLEGKNLLNVRDAKGDYIVKKAIDMIRTKKEGFAKWYWYKPVNRHISEKSKPYQKIGYIKYVKPLDWFIGTGIYIKSALHKVESRFVSLYEKEKEKNGEYFIVLKPLGKNRAQILANSNRPYLKGDIINGQFKDINDSKYMNKIFDSIFKKKTEGILDYIYRDRLGKHKEIIFYTFYKKFVFLVIYGFNLDNVELIVKQARNKYKKDFDNYVNDAFLFAVIIILSVGILFLFISRRVNMVFFKYKKDVEEKEEKLEKLAMYDSLTGIYNRNKFNEILKYEMNMSKRYKTPLSLVMFDLDHFKRINDKYGHDTGDKVLKKVADTIRNNIRLTDTLARWGGEEFFLILPKTDIDKARNIAETLRVKIEDMDCECADKITCSFGVTCLKENDSEDELIKRADDAMYLAKKRGRNRVEVL